MDGNLSDFVNTALNKSSLSLEDETDQRTCKETLTKLKEVKNLLKMDKVYLNMYNITPPHS